LEKELSFAELEKEAGYVFLKDNQMTEEMYSSLPSFNDWKNGVLNDNKGVDNPVEDYQSPTPFDEEFKVEKKPDEEKLSLLEEEQERSKSKRLEAERQRELEAEDRNKEFFERESQLSVQAVDGVQKLDMISDLGKLSDLGKAAGMGLDGTGVSMAGYVAGEMLEKAGFSAIKNALGGKPNKNEKEDEEPAYKQGIADNPFESFNDPYYNKRN